jgi:hypothetical protein
MKTVGCYSWTVVRSARGREQGRNAQDAACSARSIVGGASSRRFFELCADAIATGRRSHAKTAELRACGAVSLLLALSLASMRTAYHQCTIVAGDGSSKRYMASAHEA